MAPISTRVESVTLYHRGATVRRTAELDCSKGAPAEVLVAGLPLSLIDHTLRVRVETGAGELVVSNVRIGLYAPPRGTPELPPDEKELRALEKALELQRDHLGQLEAEAGRLASFPVLARPTPEEGRMPNASPMPARFALEQLADEALAARTAELRKLRDDVRDLEEKAAALRRRIELASTAKRVRPDELTKSVHATIIGKDAAPAKAKLVLEYFVLGARWAPVYQCHMSRDCRKADVQLRASVCQRTGEDWNGVQLSLSTASPMSWTELPELSSIRIGKAQPPPPGKRGFRPPPMGGESLFLDFDRGLAQARAALPVITTWAPPPVAAPTPLPQMQPLRDLAPEAPAELGAAMDELAAEEEADYAPTAKAPRPPPAPPPAMTMSAMAVAAGPAMMERASRAAPAPARKMAARPGAAGGAARLRAEEQAEGLADFGGAAAASLEVVLYVSLRLGAASDPVRGKLKPVERRQAYLESLAALGLEVHFDVLSLVMRAESQGQEVHSLGAPSGTSDVRAAAGFYDYVYRTDAAVDVPSDGTFHSVPVSTRSAAGDVLYVTVPREDVSVYRQAMVRNPLPSPLLPGPVEVYVAGEYVLTTALPPVAPGGDFKLSLGVEQAIKVARNTKYKEQRSGDKVVATNELIHDVAIELVNNLDREVQCEVRERIPQPAPDAEVVVDEGAVTPAWEKYTQEERGQVLEGGRRWRVTVKPGASQALAAQYRVKLYANNELTGGNRREA